MDAEVRSVADGGDEPRTRRGDIKFILLGFYLSVPSMVMN